MKRLSVLLALVAAAACSDSPSAPVDTPAPAVVEITPHDVSLLSIGAAQTLQASVKDAAGRTIPNANVTWSSSDSTRVRVSSTGVVTALAAGSATVIARSATAAGTANVVVTPAVAAIEIAPASVTLSGIGTNAQLSATIRDAGGTTIPGATATWSSSDTTRVRVSSTGVVTSVALGSATITAQSGTVTATRLVTVTLSGPPPASPIVLNVLGFGSVLERYTSEIAVHGNVAYTGTWSCRTSACGNAIKIWNVAGTTPLLVDSLIVPNAGTVGDLQVSTDTGRPLLLAANEYSPNGAISIYDLTTPTKPSLLSRFTTTEIARGVHTAKVARVNGRNYAFLSINQAAGSAARLVIVDINDPANPVQVFHQTMGQPYVHDVFVRDGILFTALWDAGLTIWDIGGGSRGGTPSAPVQIGNVQTVGGDVHNVHWFHDPVTGAKKYAFVGQESAGFGAASAGDIHVIDISNMSAPREVAFYTVSQAGTHNFAVDEPSGILYAAYYNGGVRALDIRGDLENCTAAQKAPDGRCNLGLMGREAGNALLDRSPYVWGVALAGTRLYVSDMRAGLYIVDVTPLKR